MNHRCGIWLWLDGAGSLLAVENQRLEKHPKKTWRFRERAMEGWDINPNMGTSTNRGI